MFYLRHPPQRRVPNEEKGGFLGPTGARKRKVVLALSAVRRRKAASGLPDGAEEEGKDPWRWCWGHQLRRRRRQHRRGVGGTDDEEAESALMRRVHLCWRRGSKSLPMARNRWWWRGREGHRTAPRKRRGEDGAGGRERVGMASWKREGGDGACGAGRPMDVSWGQKSGSRMNSTEGWRSILGHVDERVAKAARH